MKKHNIIINITIIAIILKFLFPSLSYGSMYSEIDVSRLMDNNQLFISVNNYQIDLLKEHGRTGKGIRIAMIDTDITTDYVNVIKKVSFVDDDVNIEDSMSHATISAMIIQNKISPEIELYSIQALNSSGTGTYTDIIKGIYWAIQNDVDIITFSFTGHVYLDELHEAVKKADKKGIIMIAAAGNYSSEEPTYPASLPEVISVGALNNKAEIADYSNYGQYVDVYAPGDVFSYAIYGTSFSVPYVAGFVALLMEGESMTNRKIKEIFILN